MPVIDVSEPSASDVFRQEYEAEFLEDSAGVFHNIEGCLVDKAPQPTGLPDVGQAKLGDIAISCDIAKHTDFTVLIAMDRTTGACVDRERFNRLDPTSPSATSGMLADLSALAS